MTPPLAQIPNWTSLFGSPDFCACEDCLSILSPAAYLVDLLQTILASQISDGGSKTGTDLLFARRADIATLQLDCNNTNTELPYIDLVNELLENAIAPNTATKHDTTDGSSADLGAMPEYINSGAYDGLATYVFHWNLPFDLGLTQARAYLAAIPIDRSRLMQVFQTSPGAADPTDSALTAADAFVAEFLGLSPLGWKILLGASGHQPWELWGVSTSDWNGTWTVASPGPTVAQFLQQSGISFPDLVDLLTTRFAAPLGASGKAIAIEWADTATEQSCDTTKATILNLSANALGQMVQFLRLRQALEIPVLDLDLLVAALRSGSFDAAFLRQVVAASQLQSKLGLSWPELAAWWGPIPTFPDVRGGTSLYESLFLNPALLNPDPTVQKTITAVFGLNSTGTEIQDTSHFLEDSVYRPNLLAGLQISSADLDALIAALPLAVSSGKHVLNLANLSELFRATSLARALGLSIPDFLTVVALFGLNLDPASGHTPPLAPFDPTRVADAATVVAQSAFLASSGFSPADLGYLLLDRDAATSPLAPSAAALAQQLTNLLSGLAPIAAATGGSGAQWQAQAGAFVIQQLSGWLSLPVPALQAWLAPPAAPPKPPGFPTDVLSVLLDPSFVGMAAPIGAAAISSALAAPTPFNPASAPPLYYQARSLILLKKLAVLASRLSLTAAELGWLEANAGALGWLDFSTLPAYSSPPLAPFAPFYLLALMCQLRTQWIARQSFFTLLPARPPAPAPSMGGYLGSLTGLTGWNLADLNFLAGAQGWNLAVADFWNPATLLRCQNAFQALSSLNASAAQVFPWTYASLTLAQANDITNLVKNRYSFEQWPAIGKKLRDPLRQQQRDALVSYAIYDSASLFHQAFTSADDLFGYLLLDTQMSACMMTSRIIQATQSVQLFISRCLMNVEPGAVISETASRYWEWMKAYRLWQANREVFLYPENWLIPTLRDDQTDFFQTLAQSLRQNAITSDHVEAGYLAYLTSLDQVARLRVCGMYHDLNETENIDVVHVVARTEGAPFVYYYRQFVNSSYWTPWEKVGLDLAGNDVIPVVYNRRLYLVWPLLRLVSIPPPQVSFGPIDLSGGSTLQTTPPYQWVQVQIAWSQYTDNKWVAKKTSDPPGVLIPFAQEPPGDGLVPEANETIYELQPEDAISVIRADGSIDPAYFAFKAIPPASDDATDALQIECYVHPSASGKVSPPHMGIWVAQFTISGCHERVEVSVKPPSASQSQSIVPPPKMDIDSMEFALPPPSGEVFGVGDVLRLNVGIVDPSDVTLTQIQNQLSPQEVLGSTPAGDTYLLYPHQYPQFSAQDVFFEQDNEHSFFVVPHLSREVIGLQNGAYAGYANLHAPGAFYATNLLPIVNSGALAPAPGFALRSLGAGAASSGATNFKTISPGGYVNGVTGWSPKAPIARYFGDFQYYPFYHPYVCQFIRAIKQAGVRGLLQWPHPASATPPWPSAPTPAPLQLLNADYFASEYSPLAVSQPYPADDVDFTASGPYSQYNWELFYHAPMLLATQLSQNQQFEDAQKWLHYVFDPTDIYPLAPPTASSNFPYGFWKLKPFYEQTTEQTVADLVTLLDSAAPGNADAIQNFQQQVNASLDDPFNPYAIARLRTTAFQRATVMAYLDNLIAWGDSLFAQNTRESINEATQIYILAEQLLGPRPTRVERGAVPPSNYQTLSGLMVSGDLSDPLVQLENALPVSAGQLVPAVPLPYAPPPLSASTVYFCFPPNPQLLAYWDTVADRLTKIRNCENLQGQYEQLPLLAPPIPPGLLVAAAAAGGDLSTVLNALSAPSPLYRFPYLYKQAMDFCKEVQKLGDDLLKALEREDAEALADLRAAQEAALLTAMQQVYLQRVTEANLQQQNLLMYKDRIQHKHDWYATQPFMYDGDTVGLTLKAVAIALEAAAGILHATEGTAHLIPELDGGVTGVGGSATVKIKFGGQNVGHAAKGWADALGITGKLTNGLAEGALTIGKFQERQAKFQLEKELAQDELDEITGPEQQIAQLKIQIALTEQDNFALKTQQAADVYNFLQTKFTNQQLYDWMVGQISAVYFQAYQLAYQMCQRAQAAYNRDLALYEASALTFLQPSYWDNLRQGLLAAEQLSYDTQRMQASFLDNNVREFEISRAISLGALDSVNFQALLTNGVGYFNVKESFFDGDYPGHYMRRIKYVGLSFKFTSATRPATVNCTLTLLSSVIRYKTVPATPYAQTSASDSRFVDPNPQHVPLSIVTSNGGAAASGGAVAPDNGMFETTVHYILTDDRYLTFEHQGAISNWQLELSKSANSFDLSTISDIVLQIEYTSRYGGDALKKAAGG